MKSARRVLIAVFLLSMLLACQGSRPVPTSQSGPPEKATTLPTLTSIFTATPTTATATISASDTDNAPTPTLAVHGETATVSTAAARDTPTTSSQKSLRDRIVFVSKMHGQTDLWWITSDGANLEQLTNDEWIERNPQWSPDGNQFAYTSLPSRSATDRMYLWILDIREVQFRQLTDIPLDGLSAPTWSPDSRTIAYSATVADLPCIQTIDIETEVQTDITQHRQNPVWSPDGEKLFVCGPPVEIEFGAPSPVSFFSIIGTDGEHFDHLQRGWDWQREVTGAAWSSTGDRILVTAAAGKSFLPGIASLQIVRVENETASIVETLMMKCNDADCDFYSPSWFPGDGEILFIAEVPLPFRAPYDTPEPDEPEGKWWLYKATDDLSSIQAVFESELPLFDASLSPDGTKVVFVQGEYSEAEIWVLDLDSGQTMQLTNNEVEDSSPTWQPEP